jgi:hypothetical protein
MDIISKKNMLIRYEWSRKDNMLNKKKEKNQENIKQKEETFWMIKLTYINYAQVLEPTKNKFYGLNNKN